VARCSPWKWFAIVALAVVVSLIMVVVASIGSSRNAVAG
jgi:hypothetical protein